MATTTRAPRRAREELRELVVDAGMAILAEEGLRTGADLTFKRVFARVEADTGVRLTNASVIRRVWVDQADFQSEIMARVVAGTNEAGQLAAAHGLLEPLMDTFDVSTPEARWAGLVEIVRLGGAVAIETRVGTRDWELWVGVWVVTVTNPGAKVDGKLRQALSEGLEETGEAWDQLFAAMHRQLGLRLRPGLTLRQLTESTGALAAGFSLRQASRDEPQVYQRPTGPGGELQEWTLLGIGLEALALQFLELDPDWEPPADAGS
jgi:hypothetical protein